MTLVVHAIGRVVPGYQAPATLPTWARLRGAGPLRDELLRAGFSDVAVATSAGTLKVESPDVFWASFTRSAPPLVYLSEGLGPERTAAVGREYMELLRARSEDGSPTLRVDACTGTGRA
jgi:hypothetical protein